jgi:predicted RNA methylase
MKLSEEVLAVLSRAAVEGDTVFLTCGQLDRKMYEAVNKALEALGGKWNRKAKGHVFPDDPAERLEAAMLTGEVTVPKDFGFFPTPPDLAARLVQLAELQPSDTVLEPSAGQGSIADACRSVGVASIRLVELLGENARHLTAKGYDVTPGDFLALPPEPSFDAVVMNPPFGKQADIDHVLHAWEFVKPGGRLVSVMASGVLFRENRKTLEFRRLVEAHGEFEENPEGTFREAGTMVRTINVTLHKP